jgi:hypothetical protein
MYTTEVLAASPQAPPTATPTPTGGGQDAAATNKTIATATEDHQSQQHQQQLQPSNMSTTEVLAVSPQSPPTATATPTSGGQDAAATIVSPEATALPISPDISNLLLQIEALKRALADRQ